MQRPEEQLQKSVVELLRWAAPPALVWWASSNQKGTRQGYEQAILAAMGVRAGVGDLCFVLPPGGRFGCIELKAKGRKPTPQQLDFARAVEAAGGVWACCWTLGDVIGTLQSWGLKLKLTVAA